MFWLPQFWNKDAHYYPLILLFFRWGINYIPYQIFLPADDIVFVSSSPEGRWFSVNIDKIKVMAVKILALRIRNLGTEKGSIHMIQYMASHRAMVLSMEVIDDWVSHGNAGLGGFERQFCTYMFLRSRNRVVVVWNTCNTNLGTEHS